MKQLKKLATLALGLLLALGFCAFTACGGGKATAYTFYVKNADGTAATGYVQLCTVTDKDEDGDGENDLGVCSNPAKIENGKVVYTKDWQGNAIEIKEPGVYEVHVISDNNGYPGSSVELAEVYRTSADEFGEYTIILK